MPLGVTIHEKEFKLFKSHSHGNGFYFLENFKKQVGFFYI